MFILRTLLKICLLPVAFVLFIAQWLIEIVFNASMIPLGFLLLLIAGGFIYYLVCHMWTCAFLLVVIFAGIVVFLMGGILIQEACKALSGKIMGL